MQQRFYVMASIVKRQLKVSLSEAHKLDLNHKILRRCVSWIYLNNIVWKNTVWENSVWKKFWENTLWKNERSVTLCNGPEKS